LRDARQASNSVSRSIGHPVTLGATSLCFGAGGLSAGQLAKISVNGSGLGTYILDTNGYLVARPAGTLISFF